MSGRPASSSKRTSTQRKGRRAPASRLKSSVVVLSVAAGFFLFAAVITLLAPSYRISLDRLSSTTVEVRVERRILWIIPAGTEVISPLREVKGSYEQPERGTPRKGESTADVRLPEKVGYLELRSNDKEARPMVAPSQLPTALRAVRNFLSSTSSHEQMFVIANVPASVIAPGIVTGLGVLLIFGWLWDAVQWPFARDKKK